MADKPKTADEKLDAISSHLDSLHERLDADKEERKADRARIDEVCAKMEAGEKERSDAAAAAAGPRADATGENRNVFAGAQMRLDSACQAWGHAARPPLAGESLRDYRSSILNELKQHSKVYKDSDLATIGDENAFTNVEKMIIADAIEASTSNIEAGAPLRKIVKKNDMGHTVTSFVGDPMVTWAQFMGGHTKFGRINRNPNG